MKQPTIIRASKSWRILCTTKRPKLACW